MWIRLMHHKMSVLNTIHTAKNKTTFRWLMFDSVTQNNKFYIIKSVEFIIFCSSVAPNISLYIFNTHILLNLVQ